MRIAPALIIILVCAVVSGWLGYRVGQAWDTSETPGWRRTEHRANTYTASSQYGAALTLTADGALVTWHSKRQQDSTHGAYGQRFDADGKRIGRELQLNHTTDSQQWKPSAAFCGESGLVAWESRHQDGSGAGCFLRRIDSEQEVRVHDSTQGDQLDVCLAANHKNEKAVVAATWLDRSRPWLRLFDHNARPTSAPISVADVDAEQISIGMAADGRLVAAWPVVGGGIQARCLTADGQASSPVLRINAAKDRVSIEPSLAVADDGSFVVTWLRRNQHGDSYDVMLRRFDAQGQPLAEELVVSSSHGRWQSGAHCSIDPAGRIAVMWNRERQNETSIFAKVLTARGLSEEIPVTVHRKGNQKLAAASGRPALAFAAGGRLFVSWSGDGGQEDSSGVYLTILTCNQELPPGPTTRLAQPHEPPVLVRQEEAAGARFKPGPDFGFQGPSRVQFSPADPNLAAGPNHLVMVTNDEIAFFSKTGKQTFKAPIWGTKSFWSSVGSSGKVFDPEVHWDPHAERFVAFANERVGFGTSLFVIAISDDKDPNGTWHKFRFDVTKLANTGSGGGGIDSPNLGIDNQAYYMTADIPFMGTQRHLVFIVEKKPMLSGKPPKVRTNFLISGKVKFGLPVVHGKVPGSVMFLMESLATRLNTSAKAIRLHAIQSPLSKPKLVSVDLAVPGYGSSSGITAKGTSVRVATFDNRFWSCVWRNGSLWACHHVGVGGINKARWYEIQTKAWPIAGKPVLAQSGTVDLGKGVHTAHNAITVDNKGNAMMVFAMASTNDYLSIGRAWRLKSDKLGIMPRVQIVQRSTVVNRVFRWGDYGAISPDPGQPGTVWYAHQLAASNWNWTTWIGKKVMAPLATDRNELSMQGGTVQFTLDNPSHKGRGYVLLASASGTSPGFRIGSAQVPLNFDIATQAGINLLGSPALKGFVGRLDGDGVATATFTAPKFNGLLGLTLHFAYAQDGTNWDFASNPVAVKVVK